MLRLAGGVAAAGMVVTCGADGTMRVLDPRKSFALMHTCQLTNFPYSMAVAGKKGMHPERVATDLCSCRVSSLPATKHLCSCC